MGIPWVFLLISTVSSALFFVYGQAPPQDTEPVFLAALENYTVTQGRDVYFTCVVNHLGAYKVAWIKSDSKAILAIHTHLVAHNNRLSVTHNGHNTWKLHVSNVQKNDSGTYMCQINTDPMRSQMGNLKVLIPPDILNDESSDGYVALEGGSVKLKCRTTGIPTPRVTWRREDSSSIVLRQDGVREKQVLREYEGETLLLTNVQRTDMGHYLCIAKNGVLPSVSKRFSVQVHFHPVMKVSNQLVAAPMGSDVVIQCSVETSPRAMHSWLKDTGEKLMPSTKYAMEEVAINDYSLLLNLTIRTLEKRDFGGYICSSVNALGKAEGVIRLQELSIPTKATVVPSPTYNDYNKVRKKPGGTSHNKDKPNRRRKKPRPDSEEGTEDIEVVGSGLGEATTIEARTTLGASRPPPPSHRNIQYNDRAAAALHSSFLLLVLLPLGWVF